MLKQDIQDRKFSDEISLNMKRQKLIKHLLINNCALEREGANHSWYKTILIYNLLIISNCFPVRGISIVSRKLVME